MCIRDSLYPDAPSMEQLWDKDFDVNIFGPTDRKLVLTMVFVQDYDTVLHSIEKEFTFPFDTENWEQFISDLEKDDAIAESYELSQAILLKFADNFGDTGVYEVRCERDDKIIRWYANQKNKSLRLI